MSRGCALEAAVLSIKMVRRMVHAVVVSQSASQPASEMGPVMLVQVVVALVALVARVAAQSGDGQDGLPAGHEDILSRWRAGDENT